MMDSAIKKFWKLICLRRRALNQTRANKTFIFFNLKFLRSSFQIEIQIEIVRVRLYRVNDDNDDDWPSTITKIFQLDEQVWYFKFLRIGTIDGLSHFLWHSRIAEITCIILKFTFNNHRIVSSPITNRVIHKIDEQKNHCQSTHGLAWISTSFSSRNIEFNARNWTTFYFINAYNECEEPNERYDRPRNTKLQKFLPLFCYIYRENLQPLCHWMSTQAEEVVRSSPPRIYSIASEVLSLSLCAKDGNTRERRQCFRWVLIFSPAASNGIACSIGKSWCHVRDRRENRVRGRNWFW